VRRQIAELLPIDQHGSTPDTCGHGELIFSPTNQKFRLEVSTINIETSGSREKNAIHERTCKKNKIGLIWIDHVKMWSFYQFNEDCVHGWRSTVACDIVGEFDAPYPIFKFVKDLMKKV
jgi:hypothetical protein